jgi:hypothetical protein
MSGFHALFSGNGFLGSGIVTALLSRGISPSSSTILSSIILISLIVVALPRMLSNRERAKQLLFAIPKGVVLVVAIFAAISFLVEGLCSTECATARRRTPRLCCARRARIHAFLHRDDGKPFHRRWHRGTIREPYRADTWWGDSVSRVVRLTSHTSRSFMFLRTLLIPSIQARP